MTADLLVRAGEALGAAERSRHAVPETVPRLPPWRPAPILPRHLGRYDDPYADEREGRPMTDLTDVGWVRKAAYPLADRAPAGMRDLTLELAGDLSSAARQVESQLSRLTGGAGSALSVLRAGGSLTLGPLDPGQLHRLGDTVATYEATWRAWQHATRALEDKAGGAR